MKFNPNIISVKIIGLKKQQVICETETDQIILIKNRKMILCLRKLCMTCYEPVFGSQLTKS